MKVLVTGAAGFIGFHLSKRLLDEDCQVLGIDNLNSYYDTNLKKARLAQLPQTSRFIFNQLDLADGGNLCPSSSVYGANRKVPFSEQDSVDHPISLYAATKKSNELIAHSYSHLHGMPVTGLRFFTVYGPWGRPVYRCDCPR